MIKFTDFSLHPSVVSTLDAQQFLTPTPIQEKTISLLLNKRYQDFHGQAQTGTGKTLAFGIPLIHHIAVENKTPQALIVAPTRELARQIVNTLQPFARALRIEIAELCGGERMRQQLDALRNGAQIVIGTPGRINDHIQRRTFVTKNIHTLVLDEADVMLDMGFKDEIDEILKNLPENRAIWLFSATVKSGITDIKKSHMRDVSVVTTVPAKQVSVSLTKQYFMTVSEQHRFMALECLLQKTPDFYGFVFCGTKQQTRAIARQLQEKGFSAQPLHGDLTQDQRNRVLAQFKKQQFSILVATDVASRGLDINDVTYVVNYQLPHDEESYIHRIGRTGRAGKEGTALTLVTHAEKKYLSIMQKKFSLPLIPMELPLKEYVLQEQLKKTKTFLMQKIETISKDNALTAAVREQLTTVSAEQKEKLFVRLLEMHFFPEFNVARVEKEDDRRKGEKRDDGKRFMRRHSRGDRRDRDFRPRRRFFEKRDRV